MNQILFEDFPNICRLCLGFGILQPIIKIKDLHVLNNITNINVKEEDKLPENICDSCVKLLEDISTFIATCERNDECLRKIVLQEYEKSLEHTDYCDNDYDNDQCDDPDELKNEQDNDSYCGFSIKEEYILEPNYDESDNIGPVSCENCSENFPDLQSLHDHYKEIVLCRPRQYDVETSSVPNIIDYLKKNKREKRTKKRKIASDDEEPEFIKGRQLKGKRRFLCCYCGKNYTRKNGLDRHILSHTGVKPFECKECGKRYITKDTLKTHLLTHTGVKSHKCTICQKMFTQSSHLSYHMRRHSGEKPYSCSFCGKGFLSNYHLERHKLMHTGVKPFECKQCGKQFVRGTTLRDHLLIHTGEKPFQCQHCGKQFNRKQSLTNHVLVHTGQVRHNSGNGGIVRLHNKGLTGALGQNDRSDVGLNGDNGELLPLHSSVSIIGHDTVSAGLSNSEGLGIVAVENNLMFSGSNPVNSSY